MSDDAPLLPKKAHHGNANLSPKSKAKVAKRRQQVASLFAKGVHNAREIGKILGCSATAVACDIKWLRERWEEDAKVTYKEMVAQLMHELNVRKREAWAYYARTQKNAERTVTAEGTLKGGQEGKKTVHESKGQAGDARFFRILEAITAQEAMIMGVPQKNLDENNSGGLKLTLQMMPVELLKQINEMIDQNQDAQYIGHNPLTPIDTHFEAANEGEDAEIADESTTTEGTEILDGPPIASPAGSGDEGNPGTGASEGGSSEQTEDGGGEAKVGGSGTGDGKGESGTADSNTGQSNSPQIAGGK